MLLEQRVDVCTLGVIVGALAVQEGPSLVMPQLSCAIEQISDFPATLGVHCSDRRSLTWPTGLHNYVIGMGS
jgi:hypothetical protein